MTWKSKLSFTFNLASSMLCNVEAQNLCLFTLVILMKRKKLS